MAQLFTGHRGSDKSTELLRLQVRLKEADDLDLNDLEYTDFLLSIARRVASDLKAKGIDLPQDLLKSEANTLQAIGDVQRFRDEYDDALASYA